MGEEVIFYLNEKFTSFESLERKIEKYTKKNYVDLYKRDSRKIKSAVKGKRLAEGRVSASKEKDLVYIEIKY